jgi:hypothetical protein
MSGLVIQVFGCDSAEFAAAKWGADLVECGNSGDEEEEDDA